MQVFHLIEYERPHCVLEQKVDICANEKKQVVFKSCLLERERGILHSLELVFARNETGEAINFELSGMFKAEPKAPPAGSLHPEQTGVIKFLISPYANGLVEKRDRLLYEANFLNLKFDMTPYLGMEGSFSTPRSAPLGAPEGGSPYELFKKEDPLCAFLLSQRKCFPEIKQEEIRQQGGHVLLSSNAVSIVQGFFERKLAPLIHYRHAQDESILTCDAKEGGKFVIQLVATYFVLSPQIPRVEAHLRELKF